VVLTWGKRREGVNLRGGGAGIFTKNSFGEMQEQKAKNEASTAAIWRRKKREDLRDKDDGM